MLEEIIYKPLGNGILFWFLTEADSKRKIRE